MRKGEGAEAWGLFPNKRNRTSPLRFPPRVFNSPVRERDKGSENATESPPLPLGFKAEIWSDMSWRPPHTWKTHPWRPPHAVAASNDLFAAASSPGLPEED